MKALDSIAQDLAQSHPNDAANIVSRMEIEAAVSVLSAAGTKCASQTLIRTVPRIAAACLGAMPVAEARAIIDSVPPPVAASLLRTAEPRVAESVLADVSHAERIREYLRYPELSVGAAMDTELPAVPLHWSVGQVRKAVSEIARPYCPYLYVIDASAVLVGVLHIAQLHSLSDSAIAQVMVKPVVRLQAYSPVESILDHTAWKEYDVLPVTGRMDTLVGILRHKDLRRHTFSYAKSGDNTAFAEAVLSLGELYWSNLWKVVDGFAPSPTGPKSDQEKR